MIRRFWTEDGVGIAFSDTANALAIKAGEDAIFTYWGEIPVYFSRWPYTSREEEASRM